MTKIVYNACYGGFGLSEEAVVLYAKKCGFDVYPEGTNLFKTYWRQPNDSPDRLEYIKLDSMEWNKRTKPQIARMNELYSKLVFNYRDIPRADPNLVAVVEELGSDRASGPCAQLKIEDLPPGTLYRITEYDGYESVETRDGCEWFMA